MSQLPAGRPPSDSGGARQLTAFHAEPLFLVRQSTGSLSHKSQPDVHERPGIWPFATDLAFELFQGGSRSSRSSSSSSAQSPLARSLSCSNQGPGPPKQALPCAPGSRPSRVLPSGGSSAVTFLHVLGRGAGALLAPSGKLHSLPERNQVRVASLSSLSKPHDQYGGRALFTSQPSSYKPTGLFPRLPFQN